MNKKICKKVYICRNEKLLKNQTKVQSFHHEFEKMTLKMLLLPHYMTILLENLQKGASQGYKNLMRTDF